VGAVTPNQQALAVLLGYLAVVLLVALIVLRPVFRDLRAIRHKRKVREAFLRKLHEDAAEQGWSFSHARSDGAGKRQQWLDYARQAQARGFLKTAARLREEADKAK
jgi:flagellar biosynthesis/type III secretory pathway M-ring protein FliF/YscJ